MNLLVQEERAIVSPIAGTTREAVAERISFYHQDLLLTDTPGVRRKRTIDEKLESMMVKTAFRAVEHADVVLLIIDASQRAIADFYQGLPDRLRGNYCWVFVYQGRDARSGYAHNGSDRRF